MSSSLKHIKQNSIDVSSLSNFDEIKQINYRDVQIKIDLNNKILKGKAIIEYEIINKQTTSLVLDNKGIKIANVLLLDSQTNNQIEKLNYLVNEDHPYRDSLGTPLEIKLPVEYSLKNKSLLVEIEYEVSTLSQGIQWLDKNQTYSKKYPYMFSQCEAILARTVIPCQDSPSAKVLFSKVELIIEEGITALFGGEFVSKKVISENNISYSVFEYSLKIQIPTYLFALAAGEISYKKISERCGIYTEPALLDKAAEEFSDAEKFISTAEKYIDYPYVWGVYNILVLPQAFPYGGMENPTLTFLHPTVVVGDKSLVSVCAHEIAHSWTGNLVTNKDWNNFWMNESFTRFLENKILENVYSKEFALIEADIGKISLSQVIETIGVEHNYTSLNPQLKSEDPDDAFSVVPYEKGFNLLVYIEKLVGEEFFRDILRKHIKNNAYKSISYHSFVDLVLNEINNSDKYDEGNKKLIISKIDFDTWILKPGHCPIVNDFSCSSSIEAKLFLDELKHLTEFNDTELLSKHKQMFIDMKTNIKVVFLKWILNDINAFEKQEHYEYLVKLFNLNNGHINPEIICPWFQISLNKKDTRCYDAVVLYLKSYGRMKFVLPVFTALYKADKEFCLKLFNEIKYLYHPVPVRLLESRFKQ